MVRRRTVAFTLVELLVVVTIVVILIALLLPAMSRAIYSATLAQCGANLKSVAGSVQTYAFDHRKFYPERGLFGPNPGIPTPICLQGHASNDYDMRPPLKGYVQINKQLNDPFTIPVDLELEGNGHPIIMASYAMWWAWGYAGNAPMTRVGESWTFQNTSYNLLVGDYELLWDLERRVTASHPDLGGGAPQLIQRAGDNQPVASWAGNGTLSAWALDGTNRARLDLNNAFDDGSVRRSTGVVIRDPRFNGVPYYSDNHDFPGNFVQYVPRP